MIMIIIKRVHITMLSSQGFSKRRLILSDKRLRSFFLCILLQAWFTLKNIFGDRLYIKVSQFHYSKSCLNHITSRETKRQARLSFHFISSSHFQTTNFIICCTHFFGRELQYDHEKGEIFPNHLLNNMIHTYHTQKEQSLLQIVDKYDTVFDYTFI